VGRVWEAVVGENKSDHKRRVVNRALIVVPTPSHTSSGNSWAEYPLVDCIPDNAIA